MSPFNDVRIINASGGAGGDYAVENGAEIWWWSDDASIPENWEKDQAFIDDGLFVYGTFQIGDTVYGSPDHIHETSVDSAGFHNHTVSDSQGALVNARDGNDGANVVASTGHTHPVTDGTADGAGTHSHANLFLQRTDHYPPYHRLYVIKATARAAIPKGGIVCWFDDIGNLPSDFSICDGGTYNGMATPDLRDKFILSARNDSQVGNTGGSETHTHSMPTTDSNGSHRHYTHGGSFGASSGTSPMEELFGQTYFSGDGHTHNINSTYSDYNGDHSHGISSNSDSANNVPPFMYLYFVMRTA